MTCLPFSVTFRKALFVFTNTDCGDCHTGIWIADLAITSNLKLNILSVLLLMFLFACSI